LPRLGLHRRRRLALALWFRGAPNKECPLCPAAHGFPVLTPFLAAGSPGRPSRRRAAEVRRTYIKGRGPAAAGGRAPDIPSVRRQGGEERFLQILFANVQM